MQQRSLASSFSAFLSTCAGYCRLGFCGLAASFVVSACSDENARCDCPDDNGAEGNVGEAPPLGDGLRMFAPGARFDYQLGGAYPPPAGVSVVVRDRTDAPEPRIYSICYLNGFQAQPDALDDWEPDLILRDAKGRPVMDTAWNEALLDVSTADKRARIGAVVGAWIDDCAEAGFDGVEIDNLDTFERDKTTTLSSSDAVAMMRLLAERAHAAGLTVAQKNTPLLAAQRDAMQTDFAIVEACGEYHECFVFTRAYGQRVLMVEYTSGGFDRACSGYGAAFGVLLRDRLLVAKGQRGYRFATCD